MVVKKERERQRSSMLWWRQYGVNGEWDTARSRRQIARAPRVTPKDFWTDALRRHVRRADGMLRRASHPSAAASQPSHSPPKTFVTLRCRTVLRNRRSGGRGNQRNAKGYGRLMSAADEFTVEKKNFEIVPWPTQGWRSLDPHTGDEAGTTEGPFELHWEGDYFFGHNLAIATSNNYYLDGLGAVPERASRTEPAADGAYIYLWMSDYHPDGAQLFFPLDEPAVPFTVCLGLNSHGDDVRPEDMRAFRVPAGKGIYLAPGTWHNGVYIPPEHAPCRFLTRQGRVHARVSCSWASEFGVLLRVGLR